MFQASVPDTLIGYWMRIGRDEIQILVRYQTSPLVEKAVTLQDNLNKQQQYPKFTGSK